MIDHDSWGAFYGRAWAPPYKPPMMWWVLLTRMVLGYITAMVFEREIG
jgi:hypothetical protein